jgi:NADPH:quinone reductase-like Zn-dependent oxidoreductase
MKAVRYSQYGGVEVLDVVDVPIPTPGPNQILVQVKAAGINPGEAKIRAGELREQWPSTFPSGQGSDLAGVVAELGTGAGGFEVGDEVIGWVDTRSSQAEFAVVEAAHLIRRPSEVSWEEAGSLFVVGATAYAMVRAVSLNPSDPGAPGDVVVVSGAAGGVGSLAAQLARLAGATVIGLASEVNHEWLADHGVLGVAYGDGVAERIRAAAASSGSDRIDAFLDTVGGDYVELALELGVTPQRIDTVADFAAVQKYGVKADGNAAGASASTLAELAADVAAGTLEVPIAATYPLEQVRDAYAELDQGHTLGKIVLLP